METTTRTTTRAGTAMPARAAGNGSAGPATKRSVAGLFSDLWRETTVLVHEEAELAKADIAERVGAAARAGGAVAVGGAVAFAGFLILLFAAVNALLPVLPPDLAPWLAPLIVGAVVLGIGLVALSGGRRRLQASKLKPERAMRSLSRDQRLVEEHLR